MNYSPSYGQNPSSYITVPNPPTAADPASNQGPDHEDHRDRFPQWTQDETRQILSIRAQLDRSFSETKRNKPLWEAVAARMQQLGFASTPEQCKSKWKNLITRYMENEAMKGDRSFPFQDEMRMIYADRMEWLLKGEEKAANEEEVEEGNKHKRKKRRRKGGEVAEALREFVRRQMEREARRMEAAEAREAERMLKEEEWRREMVALAEERAAMERQCREKEEERRAREEVRDERLHAIIAAILNTIAEKGSVQD